MLRQLQQGVELSLPHSRRMSSIGTRCHELRIKDQNKEWRVIYRIDDDAILVVDVFEKKSQETPKEIVENCKRRLRTYS